jgi:hypothetical protein
VIFGEHFAPGCDLKNAVALDRTRFNPPMSEVLPFLFGAGLSKPAGFPLAAEITERVLRGESIHRHTDERYYLGPHPSPLIDSTRDYLERVLLLLQVLKTEADIYYFGDRKPNYEDLYFMAQQVLGSLTFEEDNPIANRFAQFLDETFHDLLSQSPFAAALAERAYPPGQKIVYRDRVSTISKLLRECCNYLRDIVSLLLSKPPHETAYLSWVADAAKDGTSAQKIIFTLNYDTVLETFLRGCDLQLNDGFGPAIDDDGVRYADWDMFEDSRTPQLIKLHGSLDWRINRSTSNQESQPVRLIKIVDAERAHKRFDIGAPLILIGTHNKPSFYTNPLFEDQHMRLFNVLKSARRLIVCGYSFGDKAINTRILYWLDKDRERRMVLVHPNEKDCREMARPAIARFWDEFKAQRRLHVIEKGAESVKWDEVRASL